MSGLSASAYAALHNSRSPGEAILASMPPLRRPDPARDEAAGVPVAYVPGPSMPAKFSTDFSQIVGHELVEQEDFKPLMELITYAVTIKCPDTDFSSDLYEKPTWCRVERDTDGYQVVLGGWRSLAFKQLMLIFNSDTQIGNARHITNITVRNVARTDDQTRLELALIIEYVSAAGLRRQQARLTGEPASVLSSEAASSGAMTGPRKKRLFSAFTDILWGTESS